MIDAALGGMALAATPAWAGFKPTRERTQRASTRPGLGVALVGLGSYSTGQLAPALQLTQHCHLAAIVTGTPTKVPIWQERYGIEDRHVYDYDTMHRIADDDAVHVIYVVVPTGLHAKFAMMAAATGKHVWCEKPMAMNVDECERMIAACRDHGVKLSIGYRMQHEPNTRTVIQYAKSRPFGPIQRVEALAGYPGRGGTGWRFQRNMGGGALYDMGVYTINALRYATGAEPTLVRNARQSTKNPAIFTEVDETTEYELVFPSGMIGYGRTSVGEDINRLRVDCAEGWYELTPMQSYHGVRGTTSRGDRLEQPIVNQQARQMDDDALALSSRAPLMVSGQEGLRDVRIVQAIMSAVRSRGQVQVDG